MLSTIRTIAKYERKILLRSWFFRIFSVLSLLVLFSFNMGEISEVGSMRWAYRAVPANIPYANLYLLNIAQAIIAVFLSSEFIKRDRKQDTTEVFYVRSMSNASYMLGKTWSILSIFLLINAAALVMALIFNLLGQDTYVDWPAYLYYPLLISLPTLIFIIGLSSLLMSIIRNQALTFVILLGYILSSLIYLRDAYHYLFDYMAFYLPLFHSEITGFGDWRTILTLRGLYASLGMGFIFFSILLFRRLPQSRMVNGLSLVLGIGFASFAFFLGYQHWLRYNERIQRPLEVVALNNEYLGHPRIDIASHDISLEQRPHTFAAVSHIQGRADTAAREFVFRLNPGLVVRSVRSGDRTLDFERKLHLLLVRWDTLLPAGAPVDLTITYEGDIDESALYPDISQEEKYEKNSRLLFDIGRAYAFVQPEFLLLTPEAQWYPRAGVGYSDVDPTWYRKDFIDYRLTVRTLPGLRPVSTGRPEQAGQDTYVFDPGFALPRLSLSIGRYRKQSLRADSLTFTAYYLDGHDYFQNALPDIRDTLPAVTRERLADFERRSGLKYPFDAFALVEVPGNFKTYDRVWTSLHETNQPGLVYLPERGMHTREFDFNGSVKRQKRWGRNRDRTAEEIQLMVFRNFLDEFYQFKDRNTNFSNRSVTLEESINPYYQFGQLYEMCNNLDADQWPVLNRVFESYLRNETSAGPDWMRRSSGSTQVELANMILQELSFAEILAQTDNRELIDNVIELKGEMLFSIMEARAGTGRFRDFITELVQENRFQNYDFSAFEATLDATFGVDLSQYMSKWFAEVAMPRYLIGVPVAEKVLANNREVTRIRFRVSNQGAAAGVIKVTLRPEETLEKLLYLEAGQTKEVDYLTTAEPSGIHFNTLVSGNLPNQIEYTFEQVRETAVVNAREREALVEQPVLVSNDREIIVDNEDPAFSFSHYEEVSRLREWLKPAEEEGFKYQGTRVWRPPFNWTATTNDRFFGQFIRSAYYIAGGDGSKEARWRIPVTEPGRYEVFYHVHRDDSFGWNRDQRGIYRFTIPHQNGVDEPTIELTSETPNGWTLLGDYTFAADTITIALSNETRLQAVFADAVKLVRME